MGKTRLIVGCYTKSLPHVAAQGKGMSFVDVDTETGVFAEVSVIAGLANPSYVLHDPERSLLYAVEEMDEAEATVVVFRVDVEAASLERLASVKAHGDWPCHLGFDEDRKRLFVSNYLSGSFVNGRWMQMAFPWARQP